MMLPDTSLDGDYFDIAEDYLDSTDLVLSDGFWIEINECRRNRKDFFPRAILI
jgi:hypothetical protein